jgi:hypothetical protein
VNIAREPVLGASLGRMRGEMGVFDLDKKQFIPTGGVSDPAEEASRRHQAA